MSPRADRPVSLIKLTILDPDQASDTEEPPPKKKVMGLKCIQGMLITVNTIFALLGLILFVLGCLVRFGSDNIEQHLSDRLSGTTR